MMYKVAEAIIQTFLVFGLGAFVWKIKLIEAKDLSKLSKLTLDIFFPLLTFATIIKNFDPNQIGKLWIMPTLGLGIILVSYFLGMFFCKIHVGSSRETKNTIHHLYTMNNYVFLPIIILQQLWGDTYVTLLLIMTVGSTIGFWTIGLFPFAQKSDLKTTIKSIFSFNIISVILALIVVFFSIPIPNVILTSCTYVGNVTVPLMLVVIGAALVQGFRSIPSEWKNLIIFCIIRLFVIPIILILLLRLINLNLEFYRTLAIVAMMPASSSSVLVTREYGGNGNFAIAAMIISTLVSLVTIPILMKLFL